MADDEKMTSAQAAARLFIDSTNAGDQLGVASFSNTASTDFALAQIQDQDDGRGVRANAHDAVDRLAPLGGTSIGAGLTEAQDQIDRAGNPDAQPWIVLLSDGQRDHPAQRAARAQSADRARREPRSWPSPWATTQTRSSCAPSPCEPAANSASTSATTCSTTTANPLPPAA